jgi:outer membrane protein TolC
MQPMARTLVGLILLAVAGCAVTEDDLSQSRYAARDGISLPTGFSPGPRLLPPVILPEQRTIEHRDPAQFPPILTPPSPPPRTVTDAPETAEWQMSLDEAIRIALENARVIRVLAGTSAVARGQTIYDAAIVNTTIDQAQATFDPIYKWNSTWSRTNTPTGEFINPLGALAAPPLASIIGSTPVDSYKSDMSLSKTNVLGGTWALDWTQNPTRIASPGPFPLNPQDASAVTLSYTQPLLQGAGFNVNMAPVVIARLNTEQSFFQYKDAVQDLVRDTVEAYWTLVQARVIAWARKIQEQQSKEAYDRESARLKTGFSDVGTVSQTRVTYNQFRANRIAADADVLTREGTLRNLLGLPPSDYRQIVPTSAPTSRRLPHNWEAIVRIAEERRPDIVELKIVAEADQVRLTQAESQVLPRLDATALYRWNGLSGEMPNGEDISTRPGQFTDWSVGINFSVPLGLRQGRAQVRQQKLLLTRDYANIDQQVHLAMHQLAATVRDLDSAYEQYLAFHETRIAADINLKVQNEKFRTGQTIYLNVLQALNDWGNAVSSEAQQLLVYNASLVALEQETGTILETHGLVFVEERFKAAGPLLRLRDYPFAQPPAGSPRQYPSTGMPSEDSFDLRNPTVRTNPPQEELPRPRPLKSPE